jgi:enamine deaminase RidA (YjgF/YER057c/UK114 family)
VRAGAFVYSSGQVPMVDGSLAATGLVGAEVDEAEAKRLAQICALNALAAVNSVVPLDSVRAVIKVVGFVASAPGFYGQPGVVNGASELLGEVFGGSGHSRSAVGVSEPAVERAGRGRVDRGSPRTTDARHPGGPAGCAR